MTVFTVRSFERKLAAQGVRRTRPIHIAAEMLDPDNYDFLHNAGADEVLQTALLSAALLAKAAAEPKSGTLMNDLVCSRSSFIVEQPVPEGANLPASFGPLAAELKRSSEKLPVGIARDGRNWFNPPSETRLEPGDKLLFLTSSEPFPASSEKPESFWGPIEKDAPKRRAS
ncbi:MAG: hypothetical protein ACOX6T_08860 [Myxococcales bacterium]